MSSTDLAFVNFVILLSSVNTYFSHHSIHSISFNFVVDIWSIGWIFYISSATLTDFEFSVIYYNSSVGQDIVAYAMNIHSFKDVEINSMVMCLGGDSASFFRIPYQDISILRTILTLLRLHIPRNNRIVFETEATKFCTTVGSKGRN